MLQEDFCVGGALADLTMELQLWASYRGQLLSRTVRGATSASCKCCHCQLCSHPSPQLTLYHKRFRRPLRASSAAGVLSSQVLRH